MEPISDVSNFHPEKIHENDGSTSSNLKSENCVPEKKETNQTPSQYVGLFPQVWHRSTVDSNVSLHGFRRFKTSHLVNLRFMEEEIAEIDHKIYQAGLNLGFQPTPADRLGLETSKRDANVPKIEEIVNPALVLRLRSLLKDYGQSNTKRTGKEHRLTGGLIDQALGAFNQIMSMETFSLADDGYHASQRNDLSPKEICKTRLLRVDLGPRRAQDPFQHHIHKLIRGMRVRSFLKRNSHDEEANSTSTHKRNTSISSHDSILIAEIVGRFLVATLTAAFLIVPLTISAYQGSKGAQLCTIGIAVLIFAFLVSFLMRTTNHETMAISSAYAAVLSVIVSNRFT
jgi:hypothetical protein